MVETIKVFKVGDNDWVAAKDRDEAIKFWVGLMGEDENEWDARELSDEELSKERFADWSDEDAGRTFREVLDELIADGGDVPCLFASGDC